MQIGLKAEFELVPKSEQCSFAVREFKLPAFASPWHFHPEIELTYIVESEGRRFVGDHIAPFGPGDLVLVGPNLPHFWHNRPATNPHAAAHSLVIQFRPECFGVGFFSLPELAGVERLLKAAARGLQFAGATRNAVAAIMLEMRKRSGLEQLIDFLMIFRLLTQAAEPRALSSAGFVPSLDQRAGERINRAYQHVFAHFTEPMDYEVVARAAGMSLSAFCHYFKRVTGRTLSALVTEVRVGHARRLLIETPQTVAEVAYASGFETLSNFNRQFRELTGMSPREYRHQFQKA
jgi:AraC-like DNA-binding protein/quercetin dioxygenase-like cupin family protein